MSAYFIFILYSGFVELYTVGSRNPFPKEANLDFFCAATMGTLITIPLVLNITMDYRVCVLCRSCLCKSN